MFFLIQANIINKSLMQVSKAPPLHGCPLSRDYVPIKKERQTLVSYFSDKIQVSTEIKCLGEKYSEAEWQVTAEESTRSFLKNSLLLVYISGLQPVGHNPFGGQTTPSQGLHIIYPAYQIFTL